MKTENLSTLKIHKLTQKQYDNAVKTGNIDETALYLTPDSEEIILKSSSEGSTKKFKIVVYDDGELSTVEILE